MTERDIERLVALTLQRLCRPTLLLISEAQEYREIIYSRLASCDCAYRLAFEGDEEEASRRSLGAGFHNEAWVDNLSPISYSAMVIPFLSYSLAADVVNGVIRRPFAKAIHQALSSGLPVLALHYYCDPESEINRIKGKNPHLGYIEHVQATLMTLRRMGVTLCSLDALIAKLNGSETSDAAAVTRRYITLNDIINKKVKVDGSGLLLTDAASDYLKKKKITLNR